MRHLTAVLGSIAVLALLTARPAQPLAPDSAQALTDAGDLAVEGAFTCDLTLPGDLMAAPEPPGGVLERDRMLMARQPGMLRKHVPLAIDFTTGHLLSGGRYLFQTEEEAQAYKAFVEAFAIDGQLFLERPEFLDHDCHAWSVVAARDFADIRTSQVVLRTERWSVPADNQRQLLKARWPAIRAEAGARGMTSVWLLYNKQQGQVALVYFVNRLVPKDPTSPDFVTLFALEGSPPLGDLLNDLGYPKVFDRTHWSWTIWFPFLAGDRGEPSLWPHSPPLPEPFAGDGVCEPSRGETHDTAPSDCGPTCGDGVCQAGETVLACPSDCSSS